MEVDSPGGAVEVAAPDQPAAEVDPSGVDAYQLASQAFEAGDPAASTDGEPAPEAASEPVAETPADELAALRAENERLKGAQPEPAVPDEVQRLRRFTGAEPIHEGGPTLATLAEAVENADYDALNKMKRPDGYTGYSLEEAIELKKSLQSNQALINDSVGILHSAAWGAIGSAFDEQVKALGLDQAAIDAEAKAADSPLATSKVYLQKIVDAARKTGRDEGAKEWKGKYDQSQAEFNSYKASAAGGATRLETGGRTNGKGGAAAALALPDGEFADRAIRGDFLGLDLSE